MTWFTHKSLAVASALALDAPVTGIIATFIGSILPDLTEKIVSMGNMQVWGKIHRQAAHWFGWYFLLILLGSIYLSSIRSPTSYQTIFIESICWLGFGGITHIFLDALTPKGVPLWPLGGKQRMAFPIVTTGSINETIFFIFVLTIFIIYQINKPTQVIAELLEKNTCSTIISKIKISP